MNRPLQAASAEARAPYELMSRQREVVLGPTDRQDPLAVALRVLCRLAVEPPTMNRAAILTDHVAQVAPTVKRVTAFLAEMDAVVSASYGSVSGKPTHHLGIERPGWPSWTLEITPVAGGAEVGAAALVVDPRQVSGNLHPYGYARQILRLGEVTVPIRSAAWTDDPLPLPLDVVLAGGPS